MSHKSQYKLLKESIKELRNAIQVSEPEDTIYDIERIVGMIDSYTLLYKSKREEQGNLIINSLMIKQ